MKKSVLCLFLITFAIIANAQINDPVKWAYTAKKISNKTYELHLTATIDVNWHMYAQDAGEVPEPTVISFTANPLITFDGKVKEVGKLEIFFDKNLKSVLKYYEKKVDFVQNIKVKSSISTVAKGSVSFVVCNDRVCLPPKDVPFSINVGGK
ncbi:MAG: protein-disulfide reductase DsbD domain-containing protein [Ferruginibacter sp.]